ncbi:hypothetical protein [Lentibacillus sediminis]|uniref:hypothetical protein n=1 Tax=Lentibacillus sediminis TaxID=1940529 RepID=UPI000C1BC780|nr:hypothetical protein [Lentibacillus sediminis]
MHHTALLYLTAVLAGFALVHLPGVSFIDGGIEEFFDVVGVVVIVIFSVALIHLGFKTLLQNWK